MDEVPFTREWSKVASPVRFSRQWGTKQVSLPASVIPPPSTRFTSRFTRNPVLSQSDHQSSADDQSSAPVIPNSIESSLVPESSSSQSQSGIKESLQRVLAKSREQNTILKRQKSKLRVCNAKLFCYALTKKVSEQRNRELESENELLNERNQQYREQQREIEHRVHLLRVDLERMAEKYSKQVEDNRKLKDQLNQVRKLEKDTAIKLKNLETDEQMMRVSLELKYLNDSIDLNNAKVKNDSLRKDNAQLQNALDKATRHLHRLLSQPKSETSTQTDGVGYHNISHVETQRCLNEFSVDQSTMTAIPTIHRLKNERKKTTDNGTMTTHHRGVMSMRKHDQDDDEDVVQSEPKLEVETLNVSTLFDNPLLTDKENKQPWFETPKSKRRKLREKRHKTLSEFSFGDPKTVKTDQHLRKKSQSLIQQRRTQTDLRHMQRMKNDLEIDFDNCSETLVEVQKQKTSPRRRATVSRSRKRVPKQEVVQIVDRSARSKGRSSQRRKKSKMRKSSPPLIEAKKTKPKLPDYLDLIKENRDLRKQTNTHELEMERIKGEKYLLRDEITILQFQSKQYQSKVEEMTAENRDLQSVIDSWAPPTESESLASAAELIAHTGLFLRKYANWGKPKITLLKVNREDGWLSYSSGRYHLRTLTTIRRGANTTVFRKNKVFESEDTCFSLIFPNKTLNLQAPSVELLDVLFDVIVRTTQGVRQSITDEG